MAPKRVEGLLLAHGGDAPGMMSRILDIFPMAAKAASSGSYNEYSKSVPSIIRSWARAFGPLGGALLHFETTHEVLAILKQHRYCDLFMDTLDSHLKPNPKMHIMVTDYNQAITQYGSYPTEGLFTCLYRSSSPDRRVYAPSLQQLLAILETEPALDITAYDTATAFTGFVETWRIAHWECRGENWLNHFITTANILAWLAALEDQHRATTESVPRTRLIARMIADRLDMWDSHDQSIHEQQASPPIVNPYRHSHFSLFTEALEDWHHFKEWSPDYSYLQLNVPSRPGIFSIINDYVRSAHTHPAENHRHITRCTCRSMGDRGIILIAVPGDMDLAERLADGIRQLLCDHDIGGSIVVMPHCSTMPPIGGGGMPDIENNLTSACYKAVKFQMHSDESGVLKSICDAATSSVGDDASICYLDSRSKPMSDGHSPTSVFAIAWCVYRRKADKLVSDMNMFFNDARNCASNVKWANNLSGDKQT